MTAGAQKIEQLLSRGWEALEAIEYQGRLLFPERIYRRGPKGELIADEVMLRVPREGEIRKARAEARKLAAEDGIDPERDADLFETLDNVCLLWISIRNPKPQHEPLVGFPRELEARYDSASLAQVGRKLRALMEAIDPMPSEVNENELLAIIAALAKERTILPFAVCVPAVQVRLVLYMAERLTTSPDWKSSSASSDSSMQG